MSKPEDYATMILGTGYRPAEQIAADMVKPPPSVDWAVEGPGLLDAASNAAATLQAIYQMAERADAVSIAGIAACHTMLQSMKKNRERTQRLILNPINAAIAHATPGGETGT